jgi:spore germination protein YaaH
MIEEMKKLPYLCIIFAIILLIFVNSKYSINLKNSENSKLVIYGDNIDTNYAPFTDNGGIYISVDTIDKTIDEHIFYDKVATKIIVTNSNNVVKFKIDENKMSKNLEYSNIDTPAKLINGQPFVDINLLKDIYNIKVEYNERTNTITIDKINTSDIPLKYNKVYVYQNLNTKSNVLQILNKKNTVTVYTESLSHNRWYKIKTDSGIVGYIAKNSIDLANNASEETDKVSGETTAQNNSKMIMFWQYGSDLSVLETTKIDGVSVVSPTWYELKGSNGDISSKFSKEYLTQAKNLGYKIWPIITNGIDSVSYSAGDTSAMLNSEYNREQFIKNLLQICKNNELDGINIDFEAMKTEDKDIYTQFIRELAPILRNANIKVSIDMYFVNYIDRAGVGEASDYVVLMGYDHRGAWSTEAGSIAEVSWVEGNINSLINDSKIPSTKIILGVPFYTRLWTITAGESKPTTKVYTMKNCQEFLATNNLSTVWDEDAGQNYAEITKGDVTYKLWIEDKNSIKKRVETVNKYNLAGITGWRKGFENSDIWSTIKENLK